MDSFEINKIVAAVLMVALLLIGLSKLSNIIFHVEKPKTPSYSVGLDQSVQKETIKNVKIADDKIDSPTYAKDAAINLIQILIKKKAYGIYHLANEGKVSYFEFVKYIKKIQKYTKKITLF